MTALCLPELAKERCHPHCHIFDAKTNLSKLVDAVESGSEQEVIIALNGKPAAKLMAVKDQRSPPNPLGFLEGKYRAITLDELSASNEQIEKRRAMERMSEAASRHACSHLDAGKTLSDPA